MSAPRGPGFTNPALGWLLLGAFAGAAGVAGYLAASVLIWAVTS